MSQKAAFDYQTKNAQEILSTLIAKDIAIIDVSNTVIVSLVRDDNDRLKVGEEQAKSLLTFSGVGATIVTTALTYHSSFNDNTALKWSIEVVLIAMLVLISKCAFYSLRGLNTIQPKEITPETIGELQEQATLEECKNKLIAELVWCYIQNRSIITDKIYDVFKAKFHASFFVLAAALLGFFVFANSLSAQLHKQCSLVGIDWFLALGSGLILLGSVFSWVVEKWLTSVWSYENNKPN